MLAILVAVFVALAAGTGVVAASDGAGPGDFLFGVDLAVEDLRLRLTTDDEAESELRLKFAAERLDEAEDELTDEGDVEDIEAALTAFGEEVDAALALVDGLSPDDQATIDDAIDALLADASALGDNLEEVEFELEIEIKGGEVEIDIDFEAEGDAAADEVDDNKLAGILQAINGDQVTILTDAGPVVLQVGPNTDFKDFLAEGFRVKARQIVLPDGTLVLERIQLDNSGPGRGDDDAVVSQFKFEGTVESINADPTTGQITLTIDGQAFTLNPTSEIRDTLFAGQMFELRGAQLIDGSFVVERIELADDLGDDDLDDDDLDDDDDDDDDEHGDEHDDDDDDDEHGDEHDDDDDDDDCDNSGPGNCDDDDDDDDDD